MTFKKQYLFTDKIKQIEALRDYENNVLILNDIINELQENIVRTLLTAEQKQSLMEDARGFIDSLKIDIKSNFNFPHAKDSYNLDLLGIEYTKLNDLLSKLKSNYNPCKITGDGSLKAVDSHIKQLEKSCEVFTTSPEQNNVYKQLKTIADAANVLKAKHSNNISSAVNYFLERSFNNYIQYREGVYEVDLKKIQYVS